MDGIFCFRPVSCCRSDAGNASYGYYSLPCQRKSCYEQKQTIIKDINAMQSFGSMDVLCMDKTGTLTNESILLEYYMDIFGNENAEVLDLAYLNSCYHSGVCNTIDNAILACNTMPGREAHYANLLTKFQKLMKFPLTMLVSLSVHLYRIAMGIVSLL